MAVINFLGERGLAFRGNDELFGSPYNANYLGILELISQFDPFLAERIKTYGQKGRGGGYGQILLSLSVVNNMCGVY